MRKILFIAMLVLVSSAVWASAKFSYPVGSKGPDIKTVLNNLRDGKSTPAPAAFGNIKAEVRDTWIGVSRHGRILLREASIPPYQFEKKSLSWLVAVPAKNDRPSFDELKNSRVIAASFSNGGAAPITSVKISNGDVSYTLYNPFLGETEEHTGPLAGYVYDRLLVYSMAAWAEAMRVAYDATEVKNRINTDFQPESPIINGSLNKTFSEVLTPLYKTLAVIHSDKKLKKSYSKKDPLMIGLLEVYMRQAEQELKFSKGQTAFRIARHTHLEEAFNDRMKRFLWEGKNLNRGQVFQKLREEKSPAKREALYRYFLNYYGSLYETKDNLFDSVSKFNEIARQAGEKNYADLTYKMRFGFDTKYFSDLAQKYFDETAKDAKAYIDMINPNPGKPLYMQDVEYLDAKKAASAQSGKEKKLTPDEAVEVVEAIFKDMGIDLKKPPYTNIVFDNLGRDKKVKALGEALAATPSDTYVLMNLDPKEGVSLDELSTVLHEFVHAVHFQKSEESAGGWMGIKDLWLAPQDFPEGIAITVERLLNEGELAYRYLGKYGFTREYLVARGNVRKLKEAWDRRKLFLIALQEIGLYNETKEDGSPWAISDRIAEWNKNVRNILFAEPPKGLKYGEWAAKPHLTGKDYYLYYGAYPAGGTRTDLILDKYLKKGVAKELAPFGKSILSLFKKGSLVTAKDIMKAGR